MTALNLSQPMVLCEHFEIPADTTVWSEPYAYQSVSNQGRTAFLEVRTVEDSK